MKEMIRKTAAVMMAAALVSSSAPVNYCGTALNAAITASAADAIGAGTVIRVGEDANAEDLYFVINDVTGEVGPLWNEPLVLVGYYHAENQWEFTVGNTLLSLAGEEEKEPDGIIVTGGNGTVEEPYTVGLYYKKSVTFDANGGTGSMEDFELPAGTERFEFPECGFTAPEGCEFDHWELGGKSYQVGGAVTVSGTETAKACWRTLAEIPAVISFDANGGEGTMEDITLPEGTEKYALPECGFTDPSGCDFIGWSVDGNFGLPGDEINVSGPVTLVAQWAELDVISFDADGGEGTMESVTLPYGTEKYTLPECGFTAPEGCDFIGWSVGGETGQPGTEINVSGSMTIKAVWAELDVISFDANGGSGEMEPVVLPYGTEKYTVPECGFTAPAGCEFAGWSVDGSVGQPGMSLTVSGSVTLRAEWRELTVVSFDANGGEGGMEPVTLPYGTEQYTLPECGFTAPSGGSFIGWSVDGETLQPGEKIDITGSVTVRAEWSKETFVISFDANGGEGEMEDVTLDETGRYTLPGCSFTAPEYCVFDHWSIDGTDYAPGEEITLTASASASAEWRELPVVIYEPGDHGDGTMEAVVLDAPTKDFELPVCDIEPEEGFIFSHWYVDEYDALFVGDVIEVEGITRVRACWTEGTAVKFRANGGTGSMKSLYRPVGLYQLPECPFTPPENMKFSRWGWPDLDNPEKFWYGTPGTWIDLGRRTTVLYAQWEYLTSVTFDPNGGEGEMPVLYQETDTAEYMLPECPFTAPEGYAFNYWYSDAFGSKKPGAVVTIDRSITIKAVWKKMSLVQFDANGGSGEMADVLLEKGAEYKLPQCSFTAPARSRFRCWLIEDLGNPGHYYEYNPGAVIELDGRTTVVKADWVALASVVFDPGEGSGTMDTVYLDSVQQNYNLPQCTFEAPAGKYFSGWKFGSYSGYVPGNPITVRSGVNTVTAMWKSLPVVTFAPGTYGTGTMEDVILSSDPGDYYLPQCTFGHPDEYQFAGWRFENYNLNTGDKITVGSGIHTVTAKWKRVNVISFDANGGIGSMDKVFLDTSISGYKAPACTFTPPAKKEFDKWELVTEDGSTFYKPGQSVSVDGSLTLNAVWKDAAPTFTTNSMTLGGSISLNFFVDFGGLDESLWDQAYVEFDHKGIKSTAAFDRNSMNASGTYYKFTRRLNSISMSDDVTAVLHYFEADGTEKTVTTVRNGEQYLEKFNENDRETLWNMIRCINDFGYYMQRYLSLHAKAPWVLGVDHVAMKRAYSTTADYLAKKDEYLADIESLQKSQELVTEDVAKINFSLVLDSDTAINVKITPTDSYTAKPEVTVNGKKATVTKVDGKWQVTIPDIGAKKLGDMYTVKIKTTHGTSTFTAGAMSYAYLCIEDPTSDEQYYAMCALYEYWKAALAYK